ncbi:cysteine proteinase [Westerdykella ornata]|uniref:Cysteine proteinase n=1 Tax=Westerdykella ornata TaxID=318751 RepID=A0A6A6JXC5_WESOR|nr:cysteine proteinase [Westerdykella ornata]KAF2279719.1 cysteine proteinase [Westerdykella ornata]
MIPVSGTQLSRDFNHLIQQAYALVREAERVGQQIVAENERLRLENRKLKAEIQLNRAGKRKREDEEELEHSVKKIKQQGPSQADDRSPQTTRPRPNEKTKKPKKPSPSKPIVSRVPDTPKKPLQAKPKPNVRISKTIHHPVIPRVEKCGNFKPPSAAARGTSQAVQSSHPPVRPAREQPEPAQVCTLSEANIELLGNKNEKTGKEAHAEAVRTALKTLDADPPPLQPRGLRNRGTECFANSVLQCLATVLPPDWLEEHLNAHILTKDDSAEPSVYKPIDLFLTLIGDLRSKDKTVLTSTEFLHALCADAGVRDRELDGSEQVDAFDFLSAMLDCLSEGANWPKHLMGAEQLALMHPLIDALFRVKGAKRFTCHHCGYARLAPSDKHWVLQYIGYHQESLTVPALLDHHATPIQFDDYFCENCLHKGEAIEQWAGLQHLPEILIIRASRALADPYQPLDIDERVNPRYSTYGITLEETLDMQAYTLQDSERTKYSLQGVV